MACLPEVKCNHAHLLGYHVSIMSSLKWRHGESPSLGSMNASICAAMQVIEFFRHTYPNTMTFVREVDEWRAYLGRFGISGRLQV